jgi:hypothetical protein
MASLVSLDNKVSRDRLAVQALKVLPVGPDHQALLVQQVVNSPTHIEFGTLVVFPFNITNNGFF